MLLLWKSPIALVLVTGLLVLTQQADGKGSSKSSGSKSGSKSSEENWEEGTVTYENVDLTLEIGRYGTDVVEATLDTLDLTCVFEDDKLFLLRIAAGLTNFGQNEDTYLGGPEGGIWRVSERMLLETQTPFVLNKYQTLIRNTFGIEWDNVTLADLDIPLYSALAAKLFLQKTAIPRTLQEQAAVVENEFPVNISAESFTETIKGAEDTVCSSAAMDVILVLDGSGSVTAENFVKVLDFTKQFISAVNIGEENTRVGVLQFSENVQEEFYLNSYYDKESALRAVDDINYLEGSTNTAKALRVTANTMFSSTRGARLEDSSVSKVAIVLTDGASNDPKDTAKAAAALREEGIAVFAVGVGGAERDELNAISTDPDCNHAYQLTDFEEAVTFVEQIKRLSCKEPVQFRPGKEITTTLQPGRTIYITYPIDVEKGFKVEMSTIFGEVKTYFSTKTRNPNSASYQWKCRGNMEKRGRCFIPPGHLKKLVKGSQKTIDVYAALLGDTDEAARFSFKLASAGPVQKMSGLMLLMSLLIYKFFSAIY